MNDQSIILFDGVCNLCNGFVNFLIPRDRKNRFLFCSIQSSAGQEIMRKYNRMQETITTVILVEDSRLFTQSTAVLRIARKMNGLWPLLYGFIIIPRPVRDFIYNLVAKNRYRMFGRKETCMIPTPALKAKFLQ